MPAVKTKKRLDAASEVDQPDLTLQHLRTLRRRAIRMLSRREHSAHELRQRLATKKSRASKSGDVRHHADNHAGDDTPSLAHIDTVISQMQSLDLQSDRRFAQSLIRRRAAKVGVRGIAQLFKQHGIDASICAEHLPQLQATEFDRAYLIWHKRFRQLPDSRTDYARQARFLANRGFAPGVISKILRGAKPTE